MRKSREKRIADTQAALAAWRAAGLADDRRARFMRDSLARLERGKGLTTKQRAWLDALCEEGPPAPKGDPVLIARIDAAIPRSSAKGAEVLRDFRGRITRGWSLSPKQVAFLERLLSEASEVPVIPTDAGLAEARFAAGIVMTRNGTWKSTHPGLSECARRILAWTPEGEQRWSRSDATWLVSKIGKEHLEHHRNPKYAESDVVWTQLPIPGAPWAMGIVVGPPEPIEGSAGYPLLVSGQLRVVPANRLRVRAPNLTK